MALNTPAKILGGKLYGNYYVRFVSHGRANKYSSMTANINRKPFYAPQGFTQSYYLGSVDISTLNEFPETKDGGKYLLKNLPSDVVDSLKHDVTSFGEKTETTTIMLMIYQLR